MNLPTFVIGTMVIGFGAYCLLKTIKGGASGECSSCGSCPFAGKCSEENSFGIEIKRDIS